MSEDGSQAKRPWHERHRLVLSVVNQISSMVLTALTVLAAPYLGDLVTGSDNASGAKAIGWCVFAIVFWLAYLIYLVWFEVVGERTRAKRDDEMAVLRARAAKEGGYHDVIACLSELAEGNATMANRAASLIKTGTRERLADRSFALECKSVCKALVGVLSTRYGGARFEVSYLERCHFAEVPSVMMVVAKSTDESEHFARLGTYQPIDGEGAFFDVRQFRERGDGYTAERVIRLFDSDEIRKEFVSHPDEVGLSALKDYRQYLALPVVCPAVEGAPRNMVGLFQVVVLGAKVWTSEDDVRDMVGTYMVPLASQLLLVYKLHRVLRAASDEGDMGPTASRAVNRNFNVYNSEGSLGDGGCSGRQTQGQAFSTERTTRRSVHVLRHRKFHRGEE